MPEVDIAAGGEEDGKKTRSKSQEAIVSRFWKKEVGSRFFNTAKKLCFGEYHSIETMVFIVAKRFKVFETMFFLETMVFPEYSKNTLLPNGA